MPYLLRKIPRHSQTRKFSFSEKRRRSATPYWTLLPFLLRAHHRRSAFLRLGHGAPPRAGRIQVKLPHLIQQRFVTDPQHLCGILAAPASLFQGIGDRFHFRLILQPADEGLQPLLASHLWLFTRRGSLPHRPPLYQFSPAAFVILQNPIPLYVSFQYSPHSPP